VFPSDSFNPQKTLESVIRLKATALLGVPTMFLAELEALETTKQKLTSVRTGLIAGAPVSHVVMESIREKMNIQGMLIAYGMTETSPVTFITSLDDSTDKMFNSIGRVLPHTGAKVIDRNGQPVPVGTRGEICTSGFALQKGYWDDDSKTNEVMKEDENGVLWMHAGDEGFVDSEGYGHITGRIKDLIIRGKSHTRRFTKQGTA
jgi:acyl-CoA synthetase (AMP-forming)/AMP-acid ligase II